MGTENQPERAGFLLTRGFELISWQTDDDAFGDSSIVLEKDNLRVRIIRDRGQDFVEVSSNDQSAEWFDLSLLLQAFDSTNSSAELTDLDAQASRLVEALPELQAAFARENWETTYREVKELEVRRMKERFSGLGIRSST